MSEIKEYKGYYFSMRTDCTNLNNGIMKVLYDVELCHSQELSNSVMTLWLRNVAIDGKVITDLQFISDVKLGKTNSGSFEIDCSTQLLNTSIVVYGITYEIVLDKMDATIDVADFKHLITPYPLTEEGVYNYFLKLNHNKKSHNNLTDLSKIISDAYKVSPALANKMWKSLWDENRMLKGLQRRYFILVIFTNLVNFLGVDGSVKLLLMEEDRLNLILEQDGYGIKEVIKTLCKYYITNSKYEDLIKTCNLYQKINSINNIDVVNNEDLCFIIYSVINPRDNNYGQPSQDVTLNKIEEIDINRTIEFCKYLNDSYNRSTLHCLVAGYLSCAENKPLLDFGFVRECSDVLTTFSFNNTIDFLIRHENTLGEDETNKTLRKAISKHELFFRHGFDILEERKSWFELKISNENVFLGFFEKRKCMLTDFEIDFLIKLMLKSRWDKLQECFELVVLNGDVCRLGSLLSFISNSVHSYKRKYTHSTLNVDDGPFKLKINMQYSVFCGIEYAEIATIDKPNMIKYKDVLCKLLMKMTNESRESQTLSTAIQDLEERLD